MTFQNITKTLLVIAFCAAPCTVRATVTGITNGNFEAQQSSTTDVDSWWEGNPGSFNEFTVPGTQDNRLQGLNTTIIAGLSESGFIYQEIGTYSPGESVTVSGTLYRIFQHNTTPGVTISLFSGNVTPSDGSTLGTLGATQLASQTYSAIDLGFDGSPANTALAKPFSAVMNVGNSGVAGTKLWLQFIAIAPSGGNQIYLDNITAIGNAPVPEPVSSSLLLIGGMLAFGYARRHR